MATTIYSTSAWRDLSARAIERDGSRCLVARLLGGECRGHLHAHHIVALRDGGDAFDLDNVGTTCAAHHPMWEALRRQLVAAKVRGRPRCTHRHASAEARRLCEARLARRVERQLVLAA